MDDAAAPTTPHSYAPYWIAWVVLLVLTVIMIFISNPVVLTGGIMIKATIICWWFMHLNQEKWDLTATVIIGALFFAVFMFALFAIDAVSLVKVG
ncbi:MAG: cytochrome C oxidase subunit IV family protein [Planctomycetota bacterium]|jgi:hypothetical protein